MKMFDHVRIEVGDLEASAAFYSEALRPLGITRAFDFPEGIAFGADGGGPLGPFFLVSARGRRPVTDAHLAFAADDKATVDAFHAAALAAGGTDNGAPGLHPDYHPGYYAAFVLDPDGNNVEAVAHLATPTGDAS